MNCLVKKNENKHEQKNQRVKVAGAGPERERAGMDVGGAMGPEAVRHVRRHETVYWRIFCSLLWRWTEGTN